MTDTLTEAQHELLEDKFTLWERAGREGHAELRDYNRRAAEALKAALAIVAEAGQPSPTDAALSWLGDRRDLSIEWYCPVYGDDDDDAHEWRVYRTAGNINDREVDLVGVGDTPLLAIQSARATLEVMGRRQ